MKAALLTFVVLAAMPLRGAGLPIQHLEQKAVEVFDRHVAECEGHFPERAHGVDPELPKPLLEMRHSENIEGGGHIFHWFGAMRVAGVSLDTALRTMQNYAKYSQYFHGSVVESTAVLQTDSSESDNHYRVEMNLAHPAMWFDIAMRGVYDVHYRRLDGQHAVTSSRSLSILEYIDAHRRESGTYPEGRDYGFLWRTYTAWQIRERDGGVEMEMNSICLSRTVPRGFGWLAKKKAKESVETMLERTRAAIAANVTGSPSLTRNSRSGPAE